MSAKKLLPLILLGFVLSAEAKATDKISKCEQQLSTRFSRDLIQLEESDNLSQLLRSNSRHYWRIVARVSDIFFNKSILQTGLILGDAHLGNFGPVALGRKIIWTANDFDDGGNGYFIYDFAQLLIKTKAISKEVKYRQMWDAYLLGLQGKRMQQPQEIEELMELYSEKYKDNVNDYVDKKTKGNKFKFEEGEIEIFPPRIWGQSASRLKIEIQRYLDGYYVHDYAIRPKTRGGSRDNLRIWVLAQKKNKDELAIFELKEITAPATDELGEQQASQERIKRLINEFWGAGDFAEYGFLKLDRHLMFARPKKVDLFDVPYEPENRRDLELLTALAVWDSYLLGRMHGQQRSANSYVSRLTKDPETYLQQIKHFTKQYLEEVKKIYDRD